MFHPLQDEAGDPDPGPAAAANGSADRAQGYAWYVLFVLFLVYCLNFIDRQILSILAEDIKRDLGLRDEDLGFLYGTAFGVFYAVFGIPLGRLADRWHRVRLLTIGLGLWSLATALSGMARGAATLTAARIGVGIGEATANPAAFSMLSDHFPRRLRATALAIYSSGLYLGVGLSLGVGGLLVSSWNAAYPDGGPLGIAGWQAAFFLAGLAGFPLAIWVANLREPQRGRMEGYIDDQPGITMRELAGEFFAVVPPFTVLSAARQGMGTLALNLLGAFAIAGAVTAATLAGEPLQQWVAFGIGVYALYSWALILKRTDPAAFGLIIASPAMVSTIVAYGLIACVTYTISFWAAPYALRVIGAETSQVGFAVGGTLATAGFLGVTLGGYVSDRLGERHPAGRMMFVAFATLAPLPLAALAFTTTSLAIFVVAMFGAFALGSSALGGAAATTQDLVVPRMRGTATAAFLIGTTMLGLAIGPYVAGRISTLTGSLSTGVLSTLAVLPFALAFAVVAIRTVPAAVAERDNRARDYGVAARPRGGRAPSPTG